MIASIALPRILRVGEGASGELAKTLDGLGLRRPLIVTDRFLFESGRADQLAASLRQAGLTYRVFADTVSEPTAASIEAAYAFLAQGDHDCIVGFGGGSPMDSAKAIAVLGKHGGRMRDYKVPHVQDEAGLPIIAIPTTAGTGSEATRFTVITDETCDEKMLCVGLAYLPVAALVDYELTLSKPAKLTAETGLDALTHALEAYVSRRANQFSDTFALAALRAIGPNLRKACVDGSNRGAREAMMLGALEAGIAFSNSSVALVHGMSRPIGAHFHVPHGLSNAMLLPVVTAYSAPSALPRYAACARAMGVGRDEESDQSGVARLVAELESLNIDLAVLTPSAYGIDEARWTALLPLMAEQALASGSPGNNPITPTAQEIVALYRRAWTN